MHMKYNCCHFPVSKSIMNRIFLGSIVAFFATAVLAQNSSSVALPQDFSVEYLTENGGEYKYYILLERSGKDKWELLDIAKTSGRAPEIRNEEQELLVITGDYRKARINSDRNVKLVFHEDKITEKRSNFAFDCDSALQVQKQKKQNYTACNSYFTSGYQYKSPTLGGQRAFENRTYELDLVKQALISANVIAGIEQFKAGTWISPSAAQPSTQGSAQPFQLWLVKPSDRGAHPPAFLFRVEGLYARGDQLRIGTDQLHLVTSSFGLFGSRQSKLPWDQVFRFVVLERNRSESRGISSNSPNVACEQIYLVRKDGSTGREKICASLPEPKPFLYFTRNDGPLTKVDLVKGATKPVGSGEWQPAELKLDTFILDEVRVVEDESKVGL